MAADAKEAKNYRVPMNSLKSGGQRANHHYKHQER